MDALFWRWKYPPWVIELLEEDDLTDGTLESLESLKKHLKSEKKSWRVPIDHAVHTARSSQTPKGVLPSTSFNGSY